MDGPLLHNQQLVKPERKLETDGCCEEWDLQSPGLVGTMC